AISHADPEIGKRARELWDEVAFEWPTVLRSTLGSVKDAAPVKAAIDVFQSIEARRNELGFRDGFDGLGELMDRAKSMAFPLKNRISRNMEANEKVMGEIVAQIRDKLKQLLPRAGVTLVGDPEVKEEMLGVRCRATVERAGERFTVEIENGLNL